MENNNSNKVLVVTKKFDPFSPSQRIQEIQEILLLPLPKDEYQLAFEYLKRFYDLCSLWDDWKELHNGDNDETRFEFTMSCQSEIKWLADVWVYLFMGAMEDEI